MPVEIRELNIKGSVNSSSFNSRKLNQVNSPLLDTTFINQLRKEIIQECEERIMEKLERTKTR